MPVHTVTVLIQGMQLSCRDSESWPDAAVPRYASAELKYLPVNTVMGTRPIEELGSDGSDSESGDSSSDGSR